MDADIQCDIMSCLLWTCTSSFCKMLECACLKFTLQYSDQFKQVSKQANILYSRLFWRALNLANWSKMLLANFNLANMYTPLRTIMHAIMRVALACLEELILAI